MLMKSLLESTSVWVSPVQSSILALALILNALPSGLGAQTTYCDNFDDGNDTMPLPPWTHYDPLLPFGAGGTWSFTNGHYRIQAAASPDPGTVGQARVGSIRSENYTNFYVSVDVVDWDDALHQFCGVAGRLATVGLGTTTGYLVGHDR